MTEQSQNQQLSFSMPEWYPHLRGIPNVALRSALFAACEYGDERGLVNSILLASLSGTVIRYTGEPLDQLDLDAWETILHLARGQELVNNTVSVSTYSILQLTGKDPDSNENRKRLERIIKRLSKGRVEINEDEIEYIGGLIDSAKRKNKIWEIRLNPEIGKLFAPDMFTQIDWRVRQSLSGKYLGQWLHGFFASHAKPHPMKIGTIHDLSGSDYSELRDFKKALIVALDSLRRAFALHGHPFKYGFSSERLVKNQSLYVEKLPTRSQAKHLAKKEYGALPVPQQDKIPF